MRFFKRNKTDVLRSPCEVCGYLTQIEGERGRYFICPVCFWEDDEFHSNPDEPCDGPNYELSVNQAKANFIKYGACSEDMISNVRKPLPIEEPHINQQ